MEHMRFETPDLAAGNIEKIGELFPGCITETRGKDGNLRKAINFDLLKQMLSADVAEGDEAYKFTWVGKKAAIAEANRPIRKTLRPCPEESVDWDTTENLYIEGDNLEVLKLLQESYLGKVKMIYIDPPYNTGNDFIYRDDFSMSADEYGEQLGMYDEDSGDRLIKNTDSNGRFHSDWCSMIYSRLILARNLLAPDGAIFISIDDHEADNLKKICDEVFGADCFVSNVSWQRTYSTRNDSKGIVNEVEHILVFSRMPDWSPNKLDRTEEMDSKYKNPDNDVASWRTDNAYAPGAATHQGMVYAIQHPFTGEMLYPAIGRCWSFGQDQMLEIMCGWCPYELKDLNDAEKRAEVCGVSSESVKPNVKGIVLSLPLSESKLIAQKVFVDGPWPRYFFTKNGLGGIARKTYLQDVGGKLPTNFWAYSETGHTDEAKKELMALFEGKAPFDTPKPVRLMERILTIATGKGDIVLDFFSGSASMAHAVIQKNAQDGGQRKFIMVQIPEKTSSPDYMTICEIGKERIRRAGRLEKANLVTDGTLNLIVQTDNPEAEEALVDNLVQKSQYYKQLDIGFRVLKLADSNMEDVYYSADEITQEALAEAEMNIKPDRTDLDLLFGCLLEWSIPLSLPYRSEEIEGCKVHTYNDGDLVACFDQNIPESVIRSIASRRYDGRCALRAVFRDVSFSSSPEKINVEEIFKLLSPDTRVKVI